jgi:hypothetical protein
MPAAGLRQSVLPLLVAHLQLTVYGSGIFGAQAGLADLAVALDLLAQRVLQIRPRMRTT